MSISRPRNVPTAAKVIALVSTPHITIETIARNRPANSAPPADVVAIVTPFVRVSFSNALLIT
jgi:hypothetical protein